MSNIDPTLKDALEEIEETLDIKVAIYEDIRRSPFMRSKVKKYRLDYLKHSINALHLAKELIGEEITRGCVHCDNGHWYHTGYMFKPTFCPDCGKKLLRRDLCPDS